MQILNQLVSGVVTGTAPFVISSTTICTNLNSDYLNGQQGTYYQNVANFLPGSAVAGQALVFNGAVWTNGSVIDGGIWTTSVAAPVIRATTGLGFAAASQAVTAPTNVNGDLLLILGSTDYYGTSAVDLAPPAGWTTVTGFPKNCTYQRIYAWTKTASSEPGSYTFTASASNASVVRIISFTSGGIVDAISSSFSVVSNASQTAASVTTTGANRTIIGLFTGANGGPSFTIPSGTTVIGSTLSQTSTNSMLLAAVQFAAPIAGATSSKTGTWTISTSGGNIQIAVYSTGSAGPSNNAPNQRLQFRRGITSGLPTSGIASGEPLWDATLNRFYIGDGFATHYIGGSQLVSDLPLAVINNQSGTSYTVVVGDLSKNINFSGSFSPVALTLPQAGGSFVNGWWTEIENRNTSPLTITPTTSTIDGASTLVIGQNQGVIITSDGTNYYTFRGLAPSYPSVFDARLTPTSVTPVITTDVTGATILYLTPFKGNKISLYSGTSWLQYSLTEISTIISSITTVALSSTANITTGSAVVTSISSTTLLVIGFPVTGTGIPTGTIIKSIDSSTQVTLSANATSTTTGVALSFYYSQYDIYIYITGGVLTLQYINWTNDTTPSVAQNKQDGVIVLNSDTTKRYVGYIRLTSSTTTEHSMSKRFILNAYNRVLTKVFVTPGYVNDNASTAYTTSSTTYTPANGGVGHKSEFLCDAGVNCSLSQFRLCALSTSTNYEAGIGIDSITGVIVKGAGVTTSSITAMWSDILSVGYHYVSLLIVSPGGTASTFYADGNRLGSGADPYTTYIEGILWM